MKDFTQELSASIGFSYDRPYNLDSLEPWSERIAIEHASEEGITLTPAHWEVIDAIRNHFQEFSLAPNARSLLHRMEIEFRDLGGKKYLYDLFPRGPVNQACRIAGLPLPPHSTDPAFGSVM